MAFTISSSGKLLRDGTAVEQIASPYTNGGFAPQPKIIVMHFTMGATGRSSANWFSDRRNTFKSSAHIVVDRDGSVIQCVSFEAGANHAGRSTWKNIVGLNRHSYGIELANWGNLTRHGNGWRSTTGVSIPDPVLAVHRNGNPNGSSAPIGWEPFPAAQSETAEDIARALVAEYGCTEIVGHDDISKGRKWDPGPAFDMARFREAVLEDASDTGGNIRQVNVAEGLNLRRGPGTQFDVITLLANDTRVMVIETSGNWVMVNVLSAAGVPSQTGWVHSGFLD